MSIILLPKGQKPYFNVQFYFYILKCSKLLEMMKGNLLNISFIITTATCWWTVYYSHLNVFFFFLLSSAGELNTTDLQRIYFYAVRLYFRCYVLSQFWDIGGDFVLSSFSKSAPVYCTVCMLWTAMLLVECKSAITCKWVQTAWVQGHSFAGNYSM